MILDNTFSEHIRPADLIIERGNDTYLCYRQRTPYGSMTTAQLEPNWRIVCYRKTTAADSNTTMLLCPDGRDTYDYCPAEIDTYEFKFLI